MGGAAMDDGVPVSFVGRHHPPCGRLMTVVLRAGETLEYRPEDWQDALVVVEQGVLEVECSSGIRARFESGAVLTFTTVDLTRLHNAGTTTLVISALSR